MRLTVSHPLSSDIITFTQMSTAGRILPPPTYLLPRYGSMLCLSSLFTIFDVFYSGSHIGRKDVCY
jgi:hypothetical protein